MDEQLQIVKENSVSDQPHAIPNKSKASLKKKLDTIFTIFFGVTIFLIVFAGIYYLGTGKSILPQMKLAANPTGVVPTMALPEVTQKTQIAKSLTVPKLGKFLRWGSITKTSTNAGLMAITADKFNGEYITIPLSQGKLYTALFTGKSDPSVIVDNYTSQLKLSGWVMPDSKIPFLVFKTFRLRGIVPSSTCGSIAGYEGYKDGMVRIITIEVAAASCISPTQAKNITESQRQTTVFTFFVSDSTPVSYFTDYLSKHKK